MTDDADRALEQQQANEELHQRLLHAIRSALTHGTPIEDVKWISVGCGVSYDDVVGDEQEQGPPEETIPPFEPTHCCPLCGTWGREHRRGCRYAGTEMQHHVPYVKNYRSWA